MESTRIELARFTSNPECAKCGNIGFDWMYYRAFEANHGWPEHFKMQCQRCGWWFVMETRDHRE